MARQNVKLKLEGFDKLQEKFTRLEDDVAERAQDIVQDISFQIVNDAKVAAPADMGILRNSIRPYFYSGRTGIVGEISTNCGYGAFVEFGTGPLGRSTYKGQLPEGYVHGSGGKMPPIEVIRDWCRRHKIPESAAFVIARKIGRNGLKARPYFVPAWEKALKDFENEIRELEAIVEKVSTKGRRGRK